MTLADLRWTLCGWTRREAARRLGVTVRTVANWESGRTRPPRYVEDYYRLASGTAPTWSKWSGWRLIDDGLLDPTGQLHRPHEIQNARWLIAQLQNANDSTASREA